MSGRRLCLGLFRRFRSLLGRRLLHHDHLLDQDLVTRIDPMGIFYLAIEFPDLRPEEWVLQILFADFPEGVSSLNRVNFVSLGCRGFSVCGPVVRRLLLRKRSRRMALSRNLLALRLRHTEQRQTRQNPTKCLSRFHHAASPKTAVDHSIIWAIPLTAFSLIGGNDFCKQL